MTPQAQTFTALLIVAVASVGLVVRTFVKRRRPGCGGDCGCEAGRLKTKLKP